MSIRAAALGGCLSAGFSSLPADTKAAVLGGAFAATYSLAVGLVQSLVLAVITGRTVAAAVWVVATIVAVLVSVYLAIGSSLILSSALQPAAVTGLALVIVLRLGRRDRGPVAPKATVALEGQG